MSTDNIAHRDAIIGIVLRGWRNRAQSDLGALSFFFESFKRVIADFRLNDSANCFGVIFIELNTRLNRIYTCAGSEYRAILILIC